MVERTREEAVTMLQSAPGPSTHTQLVVRLLAICARGACSIDCLYDTEFVSGELPATDDTERGSGPCLCICDGIYHGLAPLVDQARFVLPAVTGIIYGRR